MIKLSIVIPCYNEQENLPLILKRFNQVIHRNDIEVILVDNGSTDNSSQILMHLLPQYAFARTVKVEVNQGYGFGIMQGLQQCHGEFMGWTHADMQTDPNDVIRALDVIEKLENSPKIYIKGKRQERPLFDQLFTTGMSLFETLYLKTVLSDINAQPNIFHKSFFSTLKNIPKDFSLDLFFLYHAKKSGLDIIRFPVKFTKRIHGTSKWNTGLKSRWKFIKRTIEFSRSLKKELNSCS